MVLIEEVRNLISGFDFRIQNHLKRGHHYPADGESSGVDHIGTHSVWGNNDLLTAKFWCSEKPDIPAISTALLFRMFL